MAINYGISQSGDQYIINPQLINGDGYIGLGSEVKIHIAPSNNDDVLITPNLQVTQGAASGKVLKAIDSQGNMAWKEDLSFSPYTVKSITVSYKYDGVSTQTLAGAAGDTTKVLSPTPASDSVIRVYLKNGEDVFTKELELGTDYTYDSATYTITFAEATASAYVVVYSIGADLDCSEVLAVTSVSLPLLHAVKSNLVVTDGGSTTFTAVNDYNLDASNQNLNLVPEGAIIGFESKRPLVGVSESGDVILCGPATPSTYFNNPDTLPATATVSYEFLVDDSSSGSAMTQVGTTTDYTVTLTSQADTAPTTEEWSASWLQTLTVGGNDVTLVDGAWDYDAENHIITVHTVEGCAPGAAVAWSATFGWQHIGSNASASITDKRIILESPKASISSPIWVQVSVTEGSEVVVLRPQQDFTVESDDPVTTHYARMLINEELPNQIIARNENGDALWFNPAITIEGYNPLIANKIIVLDNGVLKVTEYEPGVQKELEELVPEEGRQHNYVLAWDGTTEKVVWKSDSDSWASVVAGIVDGDRIMTTVVDGESKSVKWSSNTSVVEVAAGTGVEAHTEINSSNGLELNASTTMEINSVGKAVISASDDVAVQTSANTTSHNGGNLSLISGEGEADQNGNGGNVVIKVGAKTGTGSDGALTVQLGSIKETDTDSPLAVGSVLQVTAVSNGVATLSWAKIPQLPTSTPTNNQVLCYDSSANSGAGGLVWKDVDALVMTSHSAS